MNINTKKLDFVDFNNEEMQWVKFNNVVVYEAWKLLTRSGIPPLTLKCKGEDLIDYKIYGNSVQNGTPTTENPIEVESVGEKTKNLINVDECLNEFATKDEDGNIVLQNVFDENGTLLKRYSEFDDIDFDVGTYYFSADTLEYTTSTGNIQLQFRGESGTYYTKQITPSLGYNALVFSEKIVAFRFYLNAADTGYVKFNKFQIEKNNKVTEYEPFGYKIPIKVSDELGNVNITNIYLNEPLKENEYISFKEHELPPIPTFKGTTIIEIDTTIQPSNMEVQYYGKGVA